MEGAYPRIYPAIATKDIVLDLAFDEGCGKRVLDASGHNNHGDMINMEEGDWVSGSDGRGWALQFDGVNELISIPDNDSISGPWTAFTIAAWIYPLDNVASVIVNKSAGAGQREYQFLRASGVALTIAIGNAVGAWGLTWNPAIAVPANQWNFLVLTWTGAVASVYLDGIFQASAPYVGVTVNSAQILQIFNVFNGRGTRVTILTRDLSAADVLRLYEQPRGRYNNQLLGVGHMGAMA